VTPDKDTLKAIVNLEHNRDFQRFVEWLKDEHIKAAIDSTHRWEEQAVKIAGQAQALEMLIERITSAEAKLKMMKDSQENPKGPIV
jgi:hypothetical protein